MSTFIIAPEGYSKASRQDLQAELDRLYTERRLTERVIVLPAGCVIDRDPQTGSNPRYA